jgi:hypothetical protein
MLLLCRPYLAIQENGRRIFSIQTVVLFTRTLRLLVEKESKRFDLKASSSSKTKEEIDAHLSEL